MATWSDWSTGVDHHHLLLERAIEIVHVDPPPAAFVGAVLAAVHAFDQARVGAVLDEADATHGLDTTIDEVVFPSLRLVGTLWAGGTMDVAHEHLLSTAVAQWAAVRSALLQPGVARKGTVLLAAGPQDLITLALDCLGLLLNSRGVTVCNLGARTPARSLLVAARSINPTVVVLTSQNPSVASDAVDSVRAVAEAGFPVYFAGASFVLQLVRQNAPGIALDSTLGESAEMLTARHTTPLPGPPATRTGGRGVAAAVARAVTVARAVVVARGAQAVETSQRATSTHRAVEAAARTAALSAARARADRAEATRSAAQAVASDASLAAAAVQRRADASATTVREATEQAAALAAAHHPSGCDREADLIAFHLSAAAQAAALTAARETAAAATAVATAVAVAAAHIARTAAELDAAIEGQVAATAAQVHATAAATAHQVAAETTTRAASVATVAEEAVAAADVFDSRDAPPLGPGEDPLRAEAAGSSVGEDRGEPAGRARPGSSAR
jgi:hypothetical protein